MDQALALAADAGNHGDVPVGALVLRPTGQVIGRGRNRRQADADPLAHAELEAIRQAAQAQRSYAHSAWNLSDCTLVVTLEPCPMCAGAALAAHISRIVFGAWDPKLGACGSVWDLPRDPHIGSQPEVIGGVGEEECVDLLHNFFGQLRPRPAH